MTSWAYAQGLGLALALDAGYGEWKGKMQDLGATFHKSSVHPDTGEPANLEVARAKGRIAGVWDVEKNVESAKDAKRAKDDLRTMVFGKKLNERLGANAISHPAKHEVVRAEIAGKTGITGGPPTKKGTGESSVKSGRLVPSSGTNWPSGDDQLWSVTVQTSGGRKTYQVKAASGKQASSIAESKGYEVVMVMPTAGRINPSDPRWKDQDTALDAKPRYKVGDTVRP